MDPELSREFSKDETQMTEKHIKAMFKILSPQGNSN